MLATVTFLIALMTYAFTVEPTASYWDCAEYISTSAKLQIGHPPGAPLFQMLGAFFSSFAFEVEQIALYGQYDVCICKCIYHTFFVFNDYNYWEKN